MPLLPPRRRRESRWEEDNRLVFNPWPLLVMGALVAALVGLGVLLWLL
ncbi:MAG: hypothetical protein M3304_10040 [Actinomycetota bacterium]|nr:hypothetical protein [Actinomycetota bacterium]